MNLLAAHLTPENAEELLALAANRSRAGIEKMLAGRFPKPDVPDWIRTISKPGAGLTTREHALAHVEAASCPPPGGDEHALAHVDAARVQARPTFPDPATRPRVAPLSPERYALQLTMGRSTHDKLRHAQELLSHQLPSGDLAAVLERALDALIEKLEKRKFAATDQPRPGRRSSNPRHVPAAVKREVRKRDGGRCTFVGVNGHRCPSRSFLEFDHVIEVARGGRATAGNLRLVCRAHNQHAAERTFGVAFMDHKRRAAREARGPGAAGPPERSRAGSTMGTSERAAAHGRPAAPPAP